MTQTTVDDVDNALLEFRAFIQTDRSWIERAACRGLDPSLFHPTSGDIKTQSEALAICNGTQIYVRNRKTRRLELSGTPPCPVRQECLDYIMSLTPTQDVSGVYGGLTHRQRRNRRAARKEK